MNYISHQFFVDLSSGIFLCRHATIDNESISQKKPTYDQYYHIITNGVMNMSYTIRIT